MTRVLRPTQPRWRVPLRPAPVNGRKRERIESESDFVDPLFTLNDGWLTMHAAVSGDPLAGQLGLPGLWRIVSGRIGQATQRVFELPPLADFDEEDELTAEDVLAECKAWALSTAMGRIADGWQPPPRAEVESWIPSGGLSLRAETEARQIGLIHEANRLALVCPILPRIPAELSPKRREWLQALLTDGQDRWRMVRIGLTETSAITEVDFSGVPPAIGECVFRTGLGALRWVVAWLVESAAFLAEPSVTCSALEVCPARG